MRHTRAFLLYSILLMNIMLPLTAETVMLYSDKSSGIGDEQSSIRYIEDGIMEVFFDAGHIIFNGNYEMSPLTEETDTLFADLPGSRIAKAGGASYVLTVRLLFTDDEKDLLPVSAEYVFIDLETDKNLTSGLMLLEKPDDWKEREPHELVQSLGKRLGMEALKGL